MESSHSQLEQKQVIHYLAPGVLFSSNSSTIADPDAGISTCATVFQVDDWYDNQFIQLKNGALQWKEIAEKPGTSGFAAARQSTNDELHVVVVDDTGKISESNRCNS